MRPIDADALLRIPNVRKVDEFDETGESVSYLAVPVECIEKAPTLDYAPVVHGEWEKEQNGFIPADMRCSECGKKYNFFSPPNFCPNCGAKMDGGKKNV